MSEHDEEPEETLSSEVHWGQVRASPYGSCLTKRNAASWHGWRNDHLETLVFPKEGFDHLYGQDTIDQVDQTPLGSQRLDKLGMPVKAAVDGHDYGSTKTPGEFSSNYISIFYFFTHMFIHSLLPSHSRRTRGQCQGQVASLAPFSKTPLATPPAH